MGRLMMVHPPILVRPTWLLVVTYAPPFTWFLSLRLEFLPNLDFLL
jgi:hypothetical protein